MTRQPEVQLISTDQSSVCLAHSLPYGLHTMFSLRHSPPHVTSQGESISGTFRLGYLDGSGRSTVPLLFDTTANTLMNALNELENVTIATASRQSQACSDSIGTDCYTWAVTFAHELGDVALLDVIEASLASGNGVVTSVARAGCFSLKGSFRLGLGGHLTSEIPHDASAADVANSLEALPAITSVDVTRRGPDGGELYMWTVTFTDLSAHDTFTSLTTGLVGVDAAVVVEATISGSLYLTFPCSPSPPHRHAAGSGYLETTSAIQSWAPAMRSDEVPLTAGESVQARLEALAGIDAVVVSRSPAAGGGVGLT